MAAPGAGGSWELGQCLRLIQLRAGFTCGGLAPHAEFTQGQGGRCCILCTLRVSVPPGDFLPGCGSAGSRINPAPAVGTAGLCLCCALSPWELLLSLPLPPPWGLCPPAALPSPTHELQWSLGAVLGVFAGNVPQPREDPFVPEQLDRALGLSAPDLDCQKSPRRRMTVKFVPVVLSDPTWQCLLCLGGCCVFALQGMNVPFPIQPSRSQRLFQEYLSFTSLWDNSISTLP